SLRGVAHHRYAVLSLLWGAEEHERLGTRGGRPAARSGASGPGAGGAGEPAGAGRDDSGGVDGAGKRGGGQHARAGSVRARGTRCTVRVDRAEEFEKGLLMPGRATRWARRAGVAALALALAPGSVPAWGPNGHRLVVNKA